MAPNTTGRPSDAPEFRPWLKHYDPQVPPHLTYPRVPLYCLLDETAARHPARPCTNFFGKRLTYRQIKKLSDRFAASVRRAGRPKRRPGGSAPAQFAAVHDRLLWPAQGRRRDRSTQPALRRTRARFLLSPIRRAETAITIPLFAKKVASLRGKTPLKRVIYSRLADFLPFPLNLVQGLQERRLLRGLRRLSPGGFQRAARSKRPQPTGIQSRFSRTIWPS